MESEVERTHPNESNKSIDPASWQGQGPCRIQTLGLGSKHMGWVPSSVCSAHEHTWEIMPWSHFRGSRERNGGGQLVMTIIIPW